MIKLEANKMTNAIARAKAMRPRVRRTGDRTYTVSGSQGNTYTVRFAVVAGQKLAECNCKAGQAGQVCYHVAAAAALNIAVHSTYSKPSAQTTTPAPASPQSGRPGSAGLVVSPRPTAAPKMYRVQNAMIIEGWAV